MKNKIPSLAGIGLKNEHIRDILAERPELGFLEIHAENYMGDGGPLLRYLEEIREHYPLSLHGVGLSIGGSKALDREHLKRLRILNERFKPGLFSEHLAWSTHDTGFLADLLPLPYSMQTFERVRDHIAETQEFMGRQMLLENPASYLSFADSTMGEAEFISRLVDATGCGLLLDVNNVFVSARNLKTSAVDYLNSYPLAHVQEIHLAGHEVSTDKNSETVLIDDHGSPVSDDVWGLYADVIARTGPLPTLIERDNNVPPLKELVAEADYANRVAGLQRKAA
jgi:uncharacterized protein (UPF0276 family)